MWLLNLDDAQLQSGLGLTPQDIVVLRAGNGALGLANPGYRRHNKTAPAIPVVASRDLEQPRRYLGEPTIDGFR